MSDKTRKIAIGAVIAGAVGYVAGILTAPKSGKETRKDIQDTAIKVKNEAEKKLKLLHSELDELIEKATLQAKELQGKAKVGWDKALAGAQVAKEKARDVLSSAHEGTTDEKDLEKVIAEVSKAIDDLKSYLNKNEKESK